MRNPFLAWLDAAHFGMAAQSVIASRMMKHMTGGDASGAEARRMVSEKLIALGSAQMAMAVSLARGQSVATAMKRGAMPFKQRVRANHKRLTRRRR